MVYLLNKKRSSFFGLCTAVLIAVTPISNAYAECSNPKSPEEEAQCNQKENAETTAAGEWSKFAVQTAGSITNIALGISAKVADATVFGKPEAEAIERACSGVDYGVTGATVATDVTIAAVVDANGAEIAGKIGGATALASMPKISSMTKNTTKEGAKASSKTAEEATKEACQVCFTTGATMAVAAATSAVSASAAGQIADNTAAIIDQTNNSHVQNYGASGFGFGDRGSAHNNAQGAGGVGKVGGKSGNGSLVSDACGALSGGGFLTCMAATNPEIAKIAKNTQLIDQLKKATGGKHIGDLVKSVLQNPNIDAANKAVGNFMGANAAQQAAINNLSATFGKIAAKSAPALNAAMAKKIAGKVPNFNSKDPALEDMLKKMMAGMQVPGEMEEKKDGPRNEWVFRQMELLDPETIMAKKEFSIFDRIAFRYRKTQPRVDNLDWTLEENRNSVNRAVASQRSRN